MNAYSKAIKKNPIPVAMVTSGCISFTSDYIT